MGQFVVHVDMFSIFLTLLYKGSAQPMNIFFINKPALCSGVFHIKAMLKKIVQGLLMNNNNEPLKQQPKQLPHLYCRNNAKDKIRFEKLQKHRLTDSKTSS